MQHDVLGRGWRFPIGFRGTGDGIAITEGDDDLRQSVLLILATRPGERVMLPDFGCRAHEVLFAPNDGAGASLVAWHVRSALERWEPRVEVLDVVSRADGRGRVEVTVRWRARASHVERSVSVGLRTGS